jgi:polygalacturonase
MPFPGLQKLLPALLLPCFAHLLSGVTLNVKDYGAKADGKTSDRDSINKAIEEAATNAGGTVYFPAGTYLTGSIRLRSNVGLQFESGATILGLR